jgi:hypothetical protein
MLRQFINSVSTKITTWEKEDLRSAVIYVRPNRDKLHVQASWDNEKIEFCPATLKAHRLSFSDPQDSIVSVIHGLKIIAETSCFGKISINPKQKAHTINGQIRFEVVWIITFHTKADISAA